MMAVLVPVEQPADHAADHEPPLSSINGRRCVGLTVNTAGPGRSGSQPTPTATSTP
jgi:hypothetical protein